MATHAPVAHTCTRRRRKKKTGEEEKEREGNDLSLEVQLDWDCSRRS